MRNWDILRSKSIVKDRWLTLRADECRKADGTIVAPYYVLEYPDWVNILALTPQKDIVVIRQYRHGIRESILELPGGAVDLCDSGPADAVQRELREETGYVVKELSEIGSISALPHSHTNKIRCFLGRGAVQIAKPQPETTEQIEVSTMPSDKFLQSAYRGEFGHPHHLATIFFALAIPGVFSKGEA